MKMTKYVEGNWLQKEDVVGRQRGEIEEVGEHKFDDKPKEKAWARFDFSAKPLILNMTNLRSLIDAYGDESDDWIGQECEVYVDPHVQFKGEEVGGIVVLPLAEFPAAQAG